MTNNFTLQRPDHLNKHCIIWRVSRELWWHVIFIRAARKEHWSSCKYMYNVKQTNVLSASRRCHVQFYMKMGWYSRDVCLYRSCGLRLSFYRLSFALQMAVLKMRFGSLASQSYRLSLPQESFRNNYYFPRWIKNSYFFF